MTEEKKLEVCEVDVNFVKNELAQLSKKPDVNKYLYLVKVLQNAREVEISDNEPKSDTE